MFIQILMILIQTKNIKKLVVFDDITVNMFINKSIWSNCYRIIY